MKPPRVKKDKTGQFYLARIWCPAIVLLCAAVFYAERLPVKTYTVADGLLRDEVFKIKQDSRGFLWFCTIEGVSRFDGYAFTNFTTDDGLPDRHVNDFLETRGGAIYLATDQGLAKLDPSGIRGSAENPLFKIYLPADSRAKSIRVLLEDENARVWVGTSDGLYQLNENGGAVEFKKVGLIEPSNKQIAVTAIAEDKNGALWIGTFKNGLFRLSPNGASENFTVREGLTNNSIASLLVDKANRVWVGMRERGGLCLLKSDFDAPKKSVVERAFSSKDGLPQWIPALFQSNEGQMWVATTNGLCQWQAGAAKVCKFYLEKKTVFATTNFIPRPRTKTAICGSARNAA